MKSDDWSLNLISDYKKPAPLPIHPFTVGSILTDKYRGEDDIKAV